MKYSISGVKRSGHKVNSEVFFDTVKFLPKNGQAEIKKRAEEKKINLRYFDDGQVNRGSSFVNILPAQ